MAAKRRRWPWILVALAVLLGVAFLALRTPDIPAAELRAKYADAQSEFVTVAPGLTVHLRDEGPKDAPAILLLHGSNASLHTWEPWVSRLKDRYRVISYDHPGHGLTGPHPQDDYSDAAFVRVVDEVAKNRGLDRFVLAGNSMGGGIALGYALAHPEKLRGLVLVDASGAPLPDSAKKSDPPLGFRLARMPVISTLMEQITPRSVIETSLKQSVSVQSVANPAAVDRYWELLRYPGNRRATVLRFAGYAARGERDLPLEKVATPTLILWGRDDKLIPVASAAVLDARIPDTRAIIYDGIGHIPMEETPARSAADLEAFIAGLPK